MDKILHPICEIYDRTKNHECYPCLATDRGVLHLPLHSTQSAMALFQPVTLMVYTML